MNCSYLECPLNAVGICASHKFAGCGEHLEQHKINFGCHSMSLKEYNIQKTKKQAALLIEYQAAFDNIIKFSSEMIKNIESFTLDLVKELESAYKKGSFESNEFNFYNEEVLFVNSVIRTIFYYKKIKNSTYTVHSFRSEDKTLSGNLDENLNGYGEILYDSGRKYKGFIMQGKENGIGLTITEANNRYFGEYLDSRKSGFGVYIWHDGNNYVGTYEGLWKGGKKSVYGKVIISTKYEYQGIFLDGLFHCEGTLRNESGAYTGNFKRSQINGLGTLKYFNGDVYIGMFKDSKQDGYGTYFYKSGDQYQGEWLQGKKNGWGKLIFNDGRICEGRWENDLL